MTKRIEARVQELVESTPTVAHSTAYFVDGAGPFCSDCAITAIKDTLIEHRFYWALDGLTQRLVDEFAIAVLDQDIVWKDCQIDEVPHTELEDGVTNCVGCEWDFAADCLECQQEASDEIVP